MKKAWWDIKERGFSLVEVLMASVVFGVLTLGIVGSFVYGRQATANAGERIRANALAEEGIEAIRNIRSASYANLIDGTYGLSQNAGVWSLSGTSDITGIFTRSVTIASSGANRKAVSANVSWPQGAGLAQTTITSQFTNWLAAITPTKTWDNAELAGSYNAAHNANKIATQGNYAYVALSAGTNDFLVINISDPAMPTLVGTLAIAGSPTNITVNGNFAYVTSSANNAELQIIDITNPASPTLSGTFNAPGNSDALSVSVNGVYAYLTRASNGGTNEFMVINITNPASPTVTGSYGNNIDMESVLLSGSYAYVGTNSNTQELLVINISTPAAPTLATSYDLTPDGTLKNLKMTGTTLLAAQGTTLRLFNASNPLAITPISSLTSTGSATINGFGIDPTGSYAFIATDNKDAEFQVANISIAATPSIIRTIDISGNSTLNDVSYNSTLNSVLGAGISNTQEITIFVKG